MYKVIWANQNLLCITGYAHLQCLTYHAFQILLEHQMSFQAFCPYVNYTSCHKANRMVQLRYLNNLMDLNEGVSS